MVKVQILSCITAIVSDVLLVWWAKSDDHPTVHLVIGFILLNIAGYLWAYLYGLVLNW